MRNFTTSRDKIKKLGQSLAVAGFWLAAWQLAYQLVAREILLVSPVQAITRLFSLAKEALFWQSVSFTCLRVLVGFLLALLVGAILAVICARFPLVRYLTAPLMRVVLSTPVASFIILVLVWIVTDRIPVLIAFLVVVPVVWGNLSTGIGKVDPQLLEMATVFHLSRIKIFRTIYILSVLPFFTAACSSGLGLAWKSAIAAEVICHPKLAVGQQIYNAKIYWETADLFAWTMAVIILSLLIERLTMWLLRLLSRRLGGTGGES